MIERNDVDALIHEWKLRKAPVCVKHLEDLGYQKVESRMVCFDYRQIYDNFIKPYWAPINIFDDERRTYIVFTDTLLDRRALKLCIDGLKKLYARENNCIILDEVSDTIELLLGSNCIKIKRGS